MGLLDFIGSIVDEVYGSMTDRPILRPERERRIYKSQRKALKKMTGCERGIKKRRTNLDRKKRAAYMRKWRREHPSS